MVPSPTLRPLRPLREIISRQARQVRQEDIGLGAFSCLPFRVFRVFRSSLPPLGETASAQFQVSTPIRVHSRFRLHLCVVAMNFFPANLRQGKAFFPGFARR